MFKTPHKLSLIIPLYDSSAGHFVLGWMGFGAWSGSLNILSSQKTRTTRHKHFTFLVVFGRLWDEIKVLEAKLWGLWVHLWNSLVDYQLTRAKLSTIVLHTAREQRSCIWQAQHVGTRLPQALSSARGNSGSHMLGLLRKETGCTDKDKCIVKAFINPLFLVSRWIP